MKNQNLGAGIAFELAKVASDQICSSIPTVKF